MATVTSSKRHLVLTSDTYTSNGDVVVGGDLTIQGTTTTLDTANLLVEDKNIIIGNVSSPSDTTADGGGITLKGASDKTISWSNANNRWDFNQGITSSGDITAANLSGTNTGNNAANTHSSLFIDRGSIDVTTASGGSNSNPFDDAHTETKVAENGMRTLNYTGASAFMYTFNNGGSASVVQIGAHYNGDDYYLRTRTDSSNWKTWKKIRTFGNTTIPTVPDSYAPTDAEANVQADWNEATTTSDAFILNKPSTFPPSSHNHDGRYPKADVSTAADSWDSTEFSQYSFSGWDANGADWTPSTGWYWGLTLPHVSNTSSYNYSGQIVISNDSNANMYVRTISNSTENSWKQVYHEGHKPTFAEIATTPTTLAGYGITDAAPSTVVNQTDFVSAANGGNFSGKIVIKKGQVWDATTQGLSTGSLHIDPEISTDHGGGAITFGASDASNGTNAQAGIYIRSDGSYGTRMYFSTTDSYATGSKAAMYINSDKDVYFLDNIDVAGDITVSGTVDGVDISALPTSFAPINAEQNVQSDWNATSGDALILNKPTILVPEFFEEKFAYQSNDLNAVYTPMVKGGLYGTSTSPVTGAIRIDLPSYQSAGMINFYVDIFEYSTGDTVTFRISGYAYNDSGATWHNCSVVNFSDDNNDYNVRFISDTANSKQCVTIGEVDTSWSYPQVLVRDAFSGYNTSESEWKNSWNITFVTSLVGTVRHNFTDNLPYADWDRLEGKPTSFAPTDAEANVQADWTEATTTSDAFILNKPSTFPPSSHNHDTTYLKLAGGTMNGNINLDENRLEIYEDAFIEGSGGQIDIGDIDGQDAVSGIAFHLMDKKVFSMNEDAAILNGDLEFTSSSQTTSADFGIIWTGWDKEGTTDNSDRAFIIHDTNVGGHSGSVLSISSMNDATDGIAFSTHASSHLRHNGHALYSEGHKPTYTELGTMAYTNLTGAPTIPSGSQLVRVLNNQDYIASGGTSGDYRDNYGAGLTIYEGYSTGANRPHTYDTTAQFMSTTGQGFELSIDWVSGSTTPLKIRSLRDCCQGWNPWTNVWTSHNFTLGSGGNLDADKVDGLHAASFIRSDAADTATHKVSFTAAESIGLKGARGAFTGEYIHLYSKVGIGHPSGWGQGNTETPSQGLSTYGGMNISYGTKAASTICGNLNIGTASDTGNRDLFLHGSTANKKSRLRTTNGNLHIDSADGNSLYLNYYYGASTNIYFGTGNGGYCGTVSSAGVLRMAGDVVAYYSFSDRRLKTNIKKTENNLDKILSLNPVEYTWKEGPREGVKEIGLIAQEVEEVVPEVVRLQSRHHDEKTEGEEYKQVDYEHLVSTLIGAMQEQQKQIDELKSQMAMYNAKSCKCKK